MFEKNREFLKRGVANMSVANLNFIEMELRKCCNHPFLLRGVEERETGHMHRVEQRRQHMIDCSGKLVLLDKLLPKLKSEGHKVRGCAAHLQGVFATLVENEGSVVLTKARLVSCNVPTVMCFVS